MLLSGYLIDCGQLLALRVFASLTRPKKLRPPDGPVILIDTFILSEDVKRDRYYTGLWEGLKETDCQVVFFVPTVVGTGNPVSMLRMIWSLRKHPDRFLLKEDILGWSDYVTAFGHRFRLQKLKIPALNFAETNIAPLVREEIRVQRDEGASLVGLLNYKFAKRLRKRGVRVKHSVDWFENQAWIEVGMRDFASIFPKRPIPDTKDLWSPLII